MRKLSPQRRPITFINTYHVNQNPLPTYNALHDPYLIGFFDNPSVRKHLRKTGVLKKKKRMSLHKPIEQNTQNNVVFQLTSRPATQRQQRKGITSSKLAKDQDLRLPSVQAQQKDKQKNTSFTKRAQTSHKTRKKQINNF